MRSTMTFKPSRFVNLFAVSAMSVAVLAACGGSGSNSPASSTTTTAQNFGFLVPAATPQAECGPGSRPETGMQGRVSQADHDAGLAAAGFTCNTELVGQYRNEGAIGTVGGFKVLRYVDKAGRECAYYDSTLLFPTNILDRELGVNVIDMSDPTNPRKVNALVTPAMLSPHESLVLSQEAGVLAAVLGNPAFGPGVVDVYDISEDCRNPVLKSSLPVGIFGHESGLTDDGKTFYAGSPGTETLVAVDISNPILPRPIWFGQYPSHGLTLSADGNRAYVAGIGDEGGVIILDTSEVQARKPNPEVKEIARVDWETRTIPQNAMPFTSDGREYLFEIDEYSSDGGGGIGVGFHGIKVGAARIIDITDETAPTVVSDLRLQVHNPENRAEIANDPGAVNPTGGYAGHYCSIPSSDNPTIAACSMILSGLRVFDISDPTNPVEVAYYNAPVQDRILTLPAPASNWAMSAPAFVPERKEIWYSDGYSGFYVVKVTNDMWK